MDEQLDLEIARGLREGRVDAWQRLYDAYAERVWRLVARALPVRSSDVPDVVQESLMAAARSAKTYSPQRGSLWLWLAGIARRHVALYYRQRARQAKVSGEYDHNEPLAESRAVDPMEAVASAELGGHVRVVLTELPTDYELVLTAKYLDEASVEQIAAGDGAGVEAIRSRLARARRAFRRAFEKRLSSFAKMEQE